MMGLRPEQDAYGQAIWAYYCGKDSFEIVERDDGYFSVSYGAKLYFSMYDDWDPIEQQAMAFVKGRVLDIGCGAGRHALYLQAKGFDVLGIDKSPLAINVCKRRGLTKATVLPIEEIRFQPNSFDTILMMGNNFGLFGSFDNARKLLKQFTEITSHDARVIAHTRDPYQTENPSHFEYQAFNRNRGRMSGQLRIRIRFEKYVTPWFDYLLVSKEELRNILEGTGWSIKKYIDANDSLYIAIIEKQNSRA